MDSILLEKYLFCCSGSSPTAVKAKSNSEMLSSHLWRKTERKNMKEGHRLWRISQNYLAFSWCYVVTYFSNASFLPGCAQLRADTYSGRHEWAWIQFCAWVVSKQVKRKLWNFTEISQTRDINVPTINLLLCFQHTKPPWLRIKQDREAKQLCGVCVEDLGAWVVWLVRASSYDSHTWKLVVLWVSCDPALVNSWL